MPEARRRSAWPMWAAVSAVLVAGAVLLAIRARAPVGGPPFAPPQVPETTYMSRIRDVREVTGAADPAKLANYRVELSNLPVVAVAGRSFWVADPEGRRILVVPNNPQTPTDAVAEGRRVSITGAVRRTDQETAGLAAGQTVYLRADSIRLGASASQPVGRGS
ncbi:MAG TPA: hypothetical protein VN442_26010 [Bryobacteraceae bacterium]|nr:hypothetical protein [Bryobacteraceae bacterium]